MAATGMDVIGAAAAAGLGGGGGGDGAAAAGVGTGMAAATGAGAAASGAGAAAAAGFLAPPPPPAVTLSLNSLSPGLTVVPSSTKRSSMMPAPGEGTGIEVYRIIKLYGSLDFLVLIWLCTLSVSISATTSSSATESPTFRSHLTSPSEIESANGGTFTILTSSPVKILHYVAEFWFQIV